jgi:hypothetical protein
MLSFVPPHASIIIIITHAAISIGGTRMNQKQAEALAAIIGGQAWQSGGGIWLVTRERGDGRAVVFNGECVCEYESDDAFTNDEEPLSCIELYAGKNGEPEWDAQDRWVIVDGKGNEFYEHDAGGLGIGWSSREEAERQARYLKGREGGVWAVRELASVITG